MGYTHYWLGEKSTNENWKEFTAASEKLYLNLPKKTESAGGYYSEKELRIVAGDGNGKPVFDGIMVDFNGSGNELNHETFRIEKTPAKSWNFCKTARKPYDLLVVAVLIAAWQILDYRFNSDGFTHYRGVNFTKIKNCDDLICGMNFYNEIMKPEVPITEDMLWKQQKEYDSRFSEE